MLSVTLNNHDGLATMRRRAYFVFLYAPTLRHFRRRSKSLGRHTLSPNAAKNTYGLQLVGRRLVSLLSARILHDCTILPRMIHDWMMAFSRLEHAGERAAPSVSKVVH